MEFVIDFKTEGSDEIHLNFVDAPNKELAEEVFLLAWANNPDVSVNVLSVEEHKIMRQLEYNINDLPELEQKIWARLLGYTKDSYLVGGAVRDILLGKEPKDFDFATSLTPEFLKDIFPEADLVGESFGVVIVDGVEIATFRGDRYFGDGDKDVEITYVDTIEEDLSRRDFTVNAMALSFRGDLIDPFDGQEDIERKVLRFVGDAEKRIWEDPCRVFRLARFAARLNFQVAGCHQAVRNNLDKVLAVAPERIQKELVKTLESAEDVYPFFELLKDFGVLREIFPELCECHGHDGGRYHPETVWEHILDAVNEVSVKFPLIRLAALFHDQAKGLFYDENVDYTKLI